MHGPSFFSFHFLSFSISFPKLTIFTILRLCMACKMWKITALTWEISSWRLVGKFHISAFPMYYSLYDWIREHEITKLKNKYLLRIQKKGPKNKHKKTWMKWNDTKIDYLIFSAMSMRKRHLFCTCSHTYRMKNNKSSTRGLSLEMSVLAKACAIVKYALH